MSRGYKTIVDAPPEHYILSLGSIDVAVEKSLSLKFRLPLGDVELSTLSIDWWRMILIIAVYRGRDWPGTVWHSNIALFGAIDKELGKVKVG